MTGNNCEYCIKKKLMLRRAMRRYCDKVFRMENSSKLYGKSNYKNAINCLYRAMKTYSCFELEKRLMRRVKFFKWRMLFMSENAAVDEAYELACELEKYLES